MDELVAWLRDHQGEQITARWARRDDATIPNLFLTTPSTVESEFGSVFMVRAED